MKKKVLIITFLVLLIAAGSLWLFLKPSKVRLLYEQAQIGIIVDNNQAITVNGRKVEVYQTTSKPITLRYDSKNLDNNYRNQVIINDQITLPLQAEAYSHNAFITNELKLVGPNIIAGTIELTFKAGHHLTGNLNSFSLRNVHLLISGNEIWSEEYPKSEYLNEPINLGENNLNPDFRFYYRESVTLTFQIDKRLLKEYGAMLDNESEVFNIACGNKNYELENKAYTDITCNIADQEVLTATKALAVTAKNAARVEVRMDGIPIPNNLTLSHNAWSPGTHTLELLAVNQYSFQAVKQISFTLEGEPELAGGLIYRVYRKGTDSTLNSKNSDLGVLVSDTTAFQEADANYHRTPFSLEPVINFVVKKGDKTAIIWKGKVNNGRTALMQIYNHESKLWDTVSTAKAAGDDTLILAYDYLGKLQYLNNDEVLVRVASVLTDDGEYEFSDRLIHATDIQYINQLYSLSAEGSAVKRAAKAALESMVQYLLNQYQDDKLRYLLFTGDFVQQQKGVTLSEWENVRTLVFDPLLEAGLPLGVSSGNHDVGAISSYQSEGVNALDGDLVYDYFSAYLGEEVFRNHPYYGASYQNNRSHYDLLTISNHPFLVLYLGWGSSFPYIHVSAQDMNWAKTVLEAHPNHTVILATHEYLKANGTRSLTGERVFTELVAEYSNIKFVFSGHLNGSAKLIDNLDDDGDGIRDRQVLQLLTNYQEEESLYGASFLRLLDFDFMNNIILFSQYSPYFRDADLFFEENNNFYREAQEFYYAFDLNQSGFGIMTDYFG